MIRVKPHRAKPDRDGQLLRNLVLFGRVLRRLGVDARLPQILTLVDALEHVDLRARRQFKDAARSILVQRREQVEIFDRAFDLFWSVAALRPRERVDLGRLLRRTLGRARTVMTPAGDAGDADGGGDEDVELLLDLRATYSAGELLRHTRSEEHTV